MAWRQGLAAAWYRLAHRLDAAGAGHLARPGTLIIASVASPIDLRVLASLAPPQTRFLLPADLADGLHLRGLEAVTGIAAARPSLYRAALRMGILNPWSAFYRPGSWLNSGQYLRIGQGRFGGQRSFRASGDSIRWFNRTFRGVDNPQLDFWNMGPWQ
jgi:hypothetical protein